MPHESEKIIDNWHNVLHRIDQACQTADCDTPVKLLAVSKTKPAWMVKALYDEGQRDFGENYLQDALEKIEALGTLDEIHWHFIGQIQSNKTATIAQYFDWVHSVDRFKIARRLSEQRPERRSALNLCLQINIDNEPQKGGVAPEDAAKLAREIETLPNLRLRGLMAIPKPANNKEQQLASFKSLEDLFQQIKSQLKKAEDFDTLSMGMSSDLESAIAAGSTMVRVGSDIFGARK